jgi:hypothetical protein
MKALDVLLRLGATFEGLRAKEKEKLSYHFRSINRWAVLRKLVNAGLASFSIGALDVGRSLVRFIEAEAPVDILRSLAQSKKQKRIQYSRLHYIPIFAAANHMARTGSKEMMDLCLQHNMFLENGPALSLVAQ